MRNAEPWLPPVTSTEGGVAGAGGTAKNSGRTGLPVSRAGSDGNAGSASAKPQAIAVAHGARKRLATPGSAFCSWITSGTPTAAAASAPGTAA